MISQSLKLRNFLSYINEFIDFTVLEAIVLIRGINSEASSPDDNNGAGKSALLDAIEWCLYGRVRGEFNVDLVKDDVIHLFEDGSRANFACVEYRFLMDDGIYYHVKREKQLGGSSLLEVKSSKDCKTWKNLTLVSGVNRRTGKRESSIKRTQQKINDILNANCDLFINSVFFEQGNTNTYAKSKGAGKDNLLRQALYLDKWTDYAGVTKLKLRVVEKEITAIEYQLDHNDPDDLESKIEQFGQVLEENAESQETYEIQLAEWIEKEKKYSKELVEATAAINQQETLRSQYTSTYKMVELLEGKVHSAKKWKEHFSTKVKIQLNNLLNFSS